MRHVDLAITAAFVIPVEPAGVLHGHTVLVDAGRIVAIAAPEVARDYLPRTRIDLPRHALLPGLVNAHTHSAMSLLRGIAECVCALTSPGSGACRGRSMRVRGR